jgi:hypothetical protein
MHVEVVGAQVTDLPLDIGAIALTINGARSYRRSVRGAIAGRCEELSPVGARTDRRSVRGP